MRAIGARSFPTCVIMDSQGKVILRNDTAGAFRPTSETRLRGSLQVVQELIDLRQAVKKDPGNQSSLGALKIVEAILEVQSTPIQQLDQLIELPGISDSLRQRYQRWRGVKPISKVLQDYVAIVRTIPRSDTAGRGREFQIAAGKILELHRQGLELKDPRVGIYSDYWRLVFEGALTQKDLPVAQKAHQTYRKAFGSRPELKNRIDRMSVRIGQLKKSLEKDPAASQQDGGRR